MRGVTGDKVWQSYVTHDMGIIWKHFWPPYRVWQVRVRSHMIWVLFESIFWPPWVYGDIAGCDRVRVRSHMIWVLFESIFTTMSIWWCYRVWQARSNMIWVSFKSIFWAQGWYVTESCYTSDIGIIWWHFLTIVMICKRWHITCSDSMWQVLCNMCTMIWLLTVFSSQLRYEHISCSIPFK